MRKGFAVNLKDHLKANSAPSAFFSGNRCFLCSGRCDGHEALCAECLNDLMFNTAACPACAKPNTASNICAECLNKPWISINTTATLFHYHYPANHLVQHIKYKQRIDIACYLGRILCQRLLKNNPTLPDCIIPVPLHSSRLISRGYNQAAELARPLSRQLHIKLDTSSCRRIRATIPQTELPAKKRKGNVRNAFSITKACNYEHVLLIDDVITTGSTVNELARMFKFAGVGRIDVLAIARAGWPYEKQPRET